MSTPHAATGPATRRLSLGIKLAYGFGDMGAALSYGTVSFFFIYYLVECVGMRPALAGTLLLSGRLIDGLIDPAVGLVSDRTRSRWGRRLPYIAVGGIPFGLSFGLLWSLPEASGAEVVALAALALFLHMVLFAVVTIPFGALTPELTSDYDERTSLTTFRTGFAVLATLVAAGAPPALVAAVNASRGLPPEARSGWSTVGWLFGAIMCLAWVVVVAVVRERPTPLEREPREGVFREYRSLLGAHGYAAVLVAFLLLTTAMGMVSAMLPFYLGSVMGLPSGLQSGMLGFTFLVSILALPLWSKVAARTGKSAGLVVGILLYGGGLSAQAFLATPGGVTPVLVATGVFIGVGMAAVMMFPWAMLPDVLEFDELETGRRRAGLVYSMFALVQKGAYAIGAFMCAQALDFFAYEPGAPTQTSAARLGIKVMIGPVAFGLGALSLVAVARYPISRESHARAREQLAERSRRREGGPDAGMQVPSASVRAPVATPEVAS